MHVSRETVLEEYEWMRNRDDRIVGIVNRTRTDLGELFDTSVDSITGAEYRQAVDEVFDDGDLAVNVATLTVLLRELDVTADYPGFVIDEVLGRELAGMIAGQQPLRMLGEATFHYVDIHVHDGEGAGQDDLDAALAAGFQTRLPGWDWTETKSPFAVDPTE